MKCSANLALTCYRWAFQRLVELLPLSRSPIVNDIGARGDEMHSLTQKAGGNALLTRGIERYDTTACGMSYGILARKEKG